MTVLCEIKWKALSLKEPMLAGNGSLVKAVALIVLVPQWRNEATAVTGWKAFLTGGLDLIDILQKILSLVDDVKSQVIHGQGFVCVVLQALLCDRQILRIEVIHLLGKLIIPRLKVRDDLREESIYARLGLKHTRPYLTVSQWTANLHGPSCRGQARSGSTRHEEANTWTLLQMWGSKIWLLMSGTVKNHL